MCMSSNCCSPCDVGVFGCETYILDPRTHGRVMGDSALCAHAGMISLLCPAMATITNTTAAATRATGLAASSTTTTTTTGQADISSSGLN